MDHTASLAWSITWTGSKQAYLTGRLLVDGGLRDDFARAYAYLRWADDEVDVKARSRDERVSFVGRQVQLIDQLYRGERVSLVAPEEEMLSVLIDHNREAHGGLESFIRNMIAIIEFDARRKGRRICQEELDWYTDSVATSVTDGGEYFIRRKHGPSTGEDRLLAVKACHVSHLLRDMLQDLADGFINIPAEYLEAHDVTPADTNSSAFRAWVRERVGLARGYFSAGKRYFDNTDGLRLKSAVDLYCARFERVLDAIEQDGFVLRANYHSQKQVPTALRMVSLAAGLAFQHYSRRLARNSSPWDVSSPRP